MVGANANQDAGRDALASVESEIRRLRREHRSLRDDVHALRRDVRAWRGGNLPTTKIDDGPPGGEMEDGAVAPDPPASDESVDDGETTAAGAGSVSSRADSCDAVDGEGPGSCSPLDETGSKFGCDGRERKPSKKKGGRRRGEKRKGGKTARNFSVRGSKRKVSPGESSGGSISAGGLIFLSVALLLSLTLGQQRDAEEGVGAHQRALWDKFKKKASDSARVSNGGKDSLPHAPAQWPMPGAVQRALQVETGALYYRVPDGGYCNSDPSNQPEPIEGAALYETVEECCEAEFSGQDNLFQKSLCIDNSPVPGGIEAPSNPPAASPTPATLPMASNQPTVFATKSVATPTPTLEFIPPPYLCNANPKTCGCPNLLKSDYRGHINVSQSGLACLRWEDRIDMSTLQDNPDAGLDENYCRNPNNATGPWCYISEYGVELCDVPTCGASPFVCNSNPEKCGCPGLLGTDYRGSINTTKDGSECAMWTAEWIENFLGSDLVSSHPDSGLGDHNYCRNIDSDRGGAWCFTEDEGLGYCDIPGCGALTAAPTASAAPSSSRRPSASPSISDQPTSSLSPTQLCPVADNQECGCEVVRQTDYRGTISATAEGIECERWDSEWVYLYYGGLVDIANDFPNAGLEDNRFCRNPAPTAFDVAWCFTAVPDAIGEIEQTCDIPSCDPCQCMPPCGQRNNEKCGCPSFFQAEECCEPSDATCRCGYLKEACRKSLENCSEHFCEEAEVECCREKSGPNCKCGVRESLCIEFPSKFTCEFAASSCCVFDGGSSFRCLCDFFTFAADVLGYDDSEYRSGICLEAGEDSFTAPTLERTFLMHFYAETGGSDWFNNTGWLSENVSQCEWFGLTCDDDGILVEVNLRGNNLIGDPTLAFNFPELIRIDISENKLTGRVSGKNTVYLQKLEHIDISQNQFTGHVEMTFASPVLSYVNVSFNNFSSAGFKRFNVAYESLRVLDLSNNEVEQEASEIFNNMPPNLEELDISNNAIRGSLPNPFPLEGLQYLSVANNHFNGPLPDFPSNVPLLRVLDLSNQKQTNEGGLIGTIPTDISKLVDLTLLNLAGNKLSEEIPSSIGSLGKLNVLNLSSNDLSQSIPSELGKLSGVLELLDLSLNQLTGVIPSSLGNLDRVSIFLGGNKDLSHPGPLTLCFSPRFDLSNDTSLCPVERSALAEFYNSAKGQEWTNSKLWMDEYADHCLWYGIECDGSNYTIKLGLRSNGLSGTLSERIAELGSLQVIDLSDNDIKGSIPTSMGELSGLTYLRLSYNAFVGNETNLGHLQDLQFIQLHGNRITGTIPPLQLELSEPESFVADCGNPSDFDESLTCEECTMCCNAQGDCYPTEDTDVQKAGFNNYMEFTGVFFAFLFLASCALALAVFCYDKYRHRHMPRSAILERSAAYSQRDKKYALSTLGDDSVYQFFLGNSVMGWIIVLATIATQIGVLFVFVRGAEIDLSDDNTDLVYTWKCPRDQDECRDTSDLDWRGWAAFAVLMIAHLLKDVINGVKLTVLSAKDRHSNPTRARFFFGGMLLTAVTLFTLYVSTIYNAAIATSNTEIIMNSVIILFITDVDEMNYGILMVIDPTWAKKMSLGESIRSNDDAEDDSKPDDDIVMMDQQKELEGEVERLKRMVEELSQRMQAQDTEGCGAPQAGYV